jgi:outer membrane biosynthesis protein TonB
LQKPKNNFDPETKMKKEEFLILLLARLIERGVPEKTAKKETEHVRTYLSESGMEELDISLDEMADGIISMLNESSEQEKTSEEVAISIVPAAEEESGSVSDELEAAIAAMDSPTEPSDKAEADLPAEVPIVIEESAQEEFAVEAEDITQPEPNEESVPAPEAEEPAQEAEEHVIEEAVSETPAEHSEPEQEPVDVIEDKPQPFPAPVHINDEEEEEYDGDIEEFFPYNKKKMKKIDSVKKGSNAWLYVAILVVTIPLAIALLGISLVLYLGFWVVLALAMIACIAVLVVFVTAGAAISLVGIVYGVVQLITGQVPVGMFEVGLGIIIGSATMFVGILVYNFAVRFIPFGMKLLAKLFRAGFRAVRSGYQSLKGAVESI